MDFSSRFDRKDPFQEKTRSEIKKDLAPFLCGKSISAVVPLKGGYSNSNFLCTTEDSVRYVVRYADRTRSVVEHELAVFHHIPDEIPHPKVVHADLDLNLLVYPFVEGELLSDIEDKISMDDLEILVRKIAQMLCQIHSVQFEGAGAIGPDRLRSQFNFAIEAERYYKECLESAVLRERLGQALFDSVKSYITRGFPMLAEIMDCNRLVHSDFNQKNILVSRKSGSWKVAMILDWEFAFSGSGLVDLGNLMRFEGLSPSSNQTWVEEAYKSAGGKLPPNWREVSQFLDSMNLLLFLSDPAERPKTHRTSIELLSKLIKAK